MKRSHPDPTLAGEACLPVGRDLLFFKYEFFVMIRIRFLSYLTVKN